MSARRRLALAVAGGAVAVAAILVAFRPSGNQPVATGAAPAFRTVDLQGHPVNLADYRGKAVLLNFWASWCIPCRREFPLLRAANGHGVSVLGVVFQDTRAAAASFMRDQGATWPGLQDPGGHIADAYHVGFRPGLPVSVLIDRDGRLSERHVGELRQADVDHLLVLATG